ncbi:nicotinate phosphoribosyltransferase [Tumebacillus sp. BK434]|uniref:nicotinate phosphoribosyltransferase n=1 Tax=Tumebacillus sp. BK434 TaxID=2512169 RepID=UPI00104782BD|nr:nicotinate phosphoribosyltransferase [Tumebacillus sp. BK434]TCP52617.1 nicotinate phosphoribosyltransferase [Tumebacillus sp. BK434]
MDNLTLNTDNYQLAMAYAHFCNGTHNQKTVFELYFRNLPFGSGYAVFAGLERVVHYLRNLRFSDEMIAFLQQQPEGYSAEFLAELRRFRFTGTLRAVREGSVVFANEPLLQVEARVMEAQIIETALLNAVNFQTLIATKAARIRKEAGPESYLIEMGTRRAHEADAAVWGTRAAYIAGFDSTSNLQAGMQFGIPTKGTHAHSWVQTHETELEAFQKFADVFPESTTLLVDTYNTLESGLPNTIRVAKELERRGKKLFAIRLDSGDIAFQSKVARRMLDEAGLPYVKIAASNDLDEHTILHLKVQGAQVDIWGVGTKLITGYDQPALGGVYKLVERELHGAMEPSIKISSNPEKITTPYRKSLYRILNQSGKAEGDYLALPGETDVLRGERIKLFDPVHTHVQKFVADYTALPMLQTIFADGELVDQLPEIGDVKAHHQAQLQQFDEEVLRNLNPAIYGVHLSRQLWQRKRELIEAYGAGAHEADWK